MKNSVCCHRPLQKSSAAEWSRRRGAAHVLVAAMMMVFIIAAALTVDVSYMQLIRTELRTATDAAAKAGAEALTRTQDEEAAKSEAVRYAALNNVGGAPFQITTDDVYLGRVQPTGNGRWQFVRGATPRNAVHVDGAINNSATTKAKPLFFGPALGVPDFSTFHESTAAKQEVDIALAMDRSGSMLFDMSGTDYSYTMPNPSLSTWSAWGQVWQYHLSPPHPTGSRWAILRNAIDLFMDEASSYRLRPRVALITWGSDYVMPIPPSVVFAASTTDVTLPPVSTFDWDTNRTQVIGALDVLTAKPMMGATNMSSGLDRAVAELTGANSQTLRSKIVILLSDGQWNTGRNPILAAQDAQAAGVTVHTISMLSVDQWTLQEVARITGGDFYSANNEAQLRLAFQEIARSLPIVLTD